MRRSAGLLLSVPALITAQTAVLDGGRLDPAWFGLSAVFQPSKTSGLQWLKPGLLLHHQSFRACPKTPVRRAGSAGGCPARKAR